MRPEGHGTPRHEARLNSIELSIVQPAVEIRKAEEGFQAAYSHSSESEAPHRHVEEGMQAPPYTEPSGVPTLWTTRLQGYLAHKKHPPRRTLHKTYA